MLRNVFIACAAVLMPFMASAQARVPLPQQPEGLAWPTAGWETGEIPPEAEATVQELIANAMAGDRYDVAGVTHGVVIIYKGKLVAEAYGEGFGPDTKHISWSLAKSVTSALVGRAVQLGLIDDIDAPMPGVFDKDDPRAAITWRQWITMTDGLDYREDAGGAFETFDAIRMMFGPGRFDVIQFIRDEFPLLNKPGTVWNYSTAGFDAVGRGLQTVAGIRSYCGTAASEASAGGTRCDPADAPMARWMRESLFDRIGMDAQPEFDPSGTYLGGSNIWASARDYAKFGYLYLRDGVWDGERVLPEGWVDQARSRAPGSNVDFYGMGFWLTPAWEDAFYAQGHEGQTIWIVPSRDLVIVRLALMDETDMNWNVQFEWNRQLSRAFPETGAH
jgi:CubicO group peptidase (beta-lactamase class C family)